MIIDSNFKKVKMDHLNYFLETYPEDTEDLSKEGQIEDMEYCILTNKRKKFQSFKCKFKIIKDELSL